MSTVDPHRFDLFDQLADELAECFRRGERPSQEEYTDRYRELAEEIRSLFPALIRVEQAEDLLNEEPPAPTPAGLERRFCRCSPS
jgi:hypothetical protein